MNFSLTFYRKLPLLNSSGLASVLRMENGGGSMGVLCWICKKCPFSTFRISSSVLVAEKNLFLFSLGPNLWLKVTALQFLSKTMLGNQLIAMARATGSVKRSLYLFKLIEKLYYYNKKYKLVYLLVHLLYLLSNCLGSQ